MSILEAKQSDYNKILGRMDNSPEVKNAVHCNCNCSCANCGRCGCTGYCDIGKCKCKCYAEQNSAFNAEVLTDFFAF